MTIGITGHQNLPPAVVSHVEHQLREMFTESSVRQLTVVTSLAAGADQLCATLLIDLGTALDVIVPCDRYEETFTNDQDLTRFRTLLARAARVERLDFPEPSENAFLAAGLRVVDLSDLVIAIWDGEPARGTGGTADIVAYAERKGIATRVLWPEGQSR